MPHLPLNLNPISSSFPNRRICKRAWKRQAKERKCLIVCTDLHCTYCGKRPRGIVPFSRHPKRDAFLSLSWREKPLLTSPPRLFLPVEWVFVSLCDPLKCHWSQVSYFFFALRPLFPLNPTPTPTPTPLPFCNNYLTRKREKWSCGYTFEGILACLNIAATGRKGKKSEGTLFFLPFAGEF